MSGDLVVSIFCHSTSTLKMEANISPNICISLQEQTLSQARASNLNNHRLESSLKLPEL
jgi:hypothetical protein